MIGCENSGRVLVVSQDGQFLKAMEIALVDQGFSSEIRHAQPKKEDGQCPSRADVLVVDLASGGQEELTDLVQDLIVTQPQLRYLVIGDASEKFQEIISEDRGKMKSLQRPFSMLKFVDTVDALLKSVPRTNQSSAPV